MNNTVINSIVISTYFVCYNREILLIKYAKPNQTTQFVRYNRVFVITVIVITEFDCMSVHTWPMQKVVGQVALLNGLNLFQQGI